MLSKLLEIWKSWSIHGAHVPFIHDPATNKPSITLIFPYITFVLSVISVIALHFKVELFVATSTTLMFWVVATVLYMIRSINKAKLDLDDKSVELDAGDEKDGEK